MIKPFNFSLFCTVVVVGSVSAFTPASTKAVTQQSKSQHLNGTSNSTEEETNRLASELRKLQRKVSELESILSKQHQAQYGSTDIDDEDNVTSMMKMKAMGMGMKKKMPSNTDGSMQGMGVKSKGMNGMQMMKQKKRMMGMNPTMSSASMVQMSMPSALPGFPGASHLYHIGETGFFLDHTEHITLSDQQRKKLNQIKESALLATATSERKIAEAEQDLWKLTAGGEPDIKKIEAKVKQIAQLQVENRIAFIRSVGLAAEALTSEQRQTLIGEGMN